MKKILFAAFTVASITVFAQQSITVTADASTTKTAQQSFSVDIPQTSLKDVKNDWLKYVAVGNKGKATFVNGEYTQTGAVNKNISPNPFTINSKLIETTAGVRLTAWLAQNNISSASGVANSNQDLAVQKFLRDFALTEYRSAVKRELKNEQNKLAALEKDLTGVIKGEEKSTKTMNANERSNERAGDAIATNNSDIKTSTEKISDQKEMVQHTAADPNATKGAKKTLAEMESEKKDLQKQNETQNKNIDNRNKETRAEDRNMQTAQQNHDAKTIAIEKQKEVVAAVQTKLDNIK